VADYLLPDVGEGLTEAEIVSWRVKEGDTIEINDIVVEIETAKSLVELPSPFAGVVTAVKPALDTASRAAVVEAKIDNPDNALRSGMFGTARITKEGGGTGIFVPKSAVYSDQSTQSYRAFVIVDGIAKLRVLQLGPEEGDSYQILDGLGADETVATSNLAQLYEGAKVAV